MQSSACLVLHSPLQRACDAPTEPVSSGSVDVTAPLLLRYRYATATLPLRYRYTTVVVALHQAAAAPLPPQSSRPHLYRHTTVPLSHCHSTAC